MPGCDLDGRVQGRGMNGMMEVKTGELIGPAPDFSEAKAEGLDCKVRPPMSGSNHRIFADGKMLIVWSCIRMERAAWESSMMADLVTSITSMSGSVGVAQAGRRSETPACRPTGCVQKCSRQPVSISRRRPRARPAPESERD